MVGDAGRSCRACGKPLRQGAAECFYCKAKVEENPTSTAPISFPPISGYAMRRFIAEGGMGAVYEAEETALGRRVAFFAWPGAKAFWSVVALSLLAALALHAARLKKIWNL